MFPVRLQKMPQADLYKRKIEVLGELNYKVVCNKVTFEDSQAKW